MGSVRVERTDNGFVARNERGAEITMGSGDGLFTPVELLLAAVGGCNIMTVEPLTAKRGHRLVRLAVEVSAEKESPTLLRSVTVTYDVEARPPARTAGRRGLRREGEPDPAALGHRDVRRG
ncbi:OsmC family protein, partial [Microbispora hainanensis]|uniref:OsmC family protein n=1 Tax=Microbispora hainanensis TaxID=568844 RepID=UPI0033D89932